MFKRIARRFKNGWVFGGEALAVMRRHPRLLVFPLLIALALLTHIGAGIYVYRQSSETSALVQLFAVYVAGWTALIYLSVALTATVVDHHRSGKMSPLAGFGVANRRLGAIVAWALFAATVGVLLRILSRVLEDSLGRVGAWIGALLGYSWLLSAYFVIPVIVMEGGTPLTVMKRSAATIKAQWGDAAGMEASMFWRLWPLLLIGVGVPAWLHFTTENMMLLALRNIWATAAFVAFILLTHLVFAALINTMGPIARARHFIYTTTGQLPAGGNPAAYASLGKA